MERDTMTGNTWADIDQLCNALVKMAEAEAAKQIWRRQALKIFLNFLMHLLLPKSSWRDKI